MGDPRRQSSQVYVSYFLWFPPELAFSRSSENITCHHCLYHLNSELIISPFLSPASNNLWIAKFSGLGLCWCLTVDSSLTPDCEPGSLVLDYTASSPTPCPFPTFCPRLDPLPDVFIVTVPRSEGIHILRTHSYSPYTWPLPLFLT